MGGLNLGLNLGSAFGAPQEVSHNNNPGHMDRMVRHMARDSNMVAEDSHMVAKVKSSRVPDTTVWAVSPMEAGATSNIATMRRHARLCNVAS